MKACTSKSSKKCHTLVIIPNLYIVNPYWTGRIYMSLPGKGLKGHMCPTILTSLWCHLERHELRGANKIITLWSGGHELLKYGK